MDWFLYDKDLRHERVKKLLRYQLHESNYKEVLDQNKVLFGLRIKKLPTIPPKSRDVSSQRNAVLFDTEENQVKLLLNESHKVVGKTKREFQYDLTLRYTLNYL